MRTLVIDTATKACSVALFDSDTLIASKYEVIGRGHAERLLPFIAELPGRGRAQSIMVNVGPGSFTGIRVGVAAARALGLAWQAEVAGYGCLQLVAAIAAATLTERTEVDVVMTGGHGEYFFQHFDIAGAPTANPASVSPELLETLLSAPSTAGDIGGDASSQHVEILPNASKWHLIIEVPPLPPSPVYCRAPDAKLPNART